MSNYNHFEWKLKAHQIKRRDGFKCQIYESENNLHVYYQDTKKK